ncbi:MAG: FkbM family methyltransferase [Acidobacteria bacterium]|nr:FkbM family methyltransferase [Acidobacteriota bacterium]
MTTIEFRYRDRGYAIEAIAGDHITNCIERAGTFYEIDLLEAIRDCKRRGTYIDVGAHIGNHSVFFSGECPSHRVVAFEPNRIALDCLVANATRYYIEVQRHAIHDTWEWCRVTDRHSTNHGMARIEESGPGHGPVCRRLDDCGLDDVAVIKIDVEGTELTVLRSAIRILERDRPIITAEAHNSAATAALEAFLTPYAYRIQGTYGFTPTHLWTAD